MMYWGNNGMHGWGFALMGVSTGFFWILLIAGIVLLLRYLGDQRPQALDRFSRPSSAERILSKRFARGEIDEAEYGRRLDALRVSAGPRTH